MCVRGFLCMWICVFVCVCVGVCVLVGFSMSSCYLSLLCLLNFRLFVFLYFVFLLIQRSFCLGFYWFILLWLFSSSFCLFCFYLFIIFWIYWLWCWRVFFTSCFWHIMLYKLLYIMVTFVAFLGDSMLWILKNICLRDIKLLMNLMNWVGRPCDVSVWMSPVCQTLLKAF